MTFTKQAAIDELINIPSHWQLTPLGKVTNGEVNPKAPYSSAWQKTDISLDEIETALSEGKATGFGLRLGQPSGFLFALDFDGESAIAKGLEIFGGLPESVSWTSGKEGRYQILFQLSAEQQQLILEAIEQSGKKTATKKIRCSEGEGLEFRYTGSQSVLPPSQHPTHGFYKWLNSPVDTAVAVLPQAVLDSWLELLKPKQRKESEQNQKQDRKQDRKPPTPKSTTSSGTAIPLENCLAHSNRDLLRGVSEGGRNDSGATLARDLIGAENYLNSIGTPYIGDARSLFNDFCNRCSPSLDDVEAQTIWDSAEADFPEPSCPPDAIANILNVWNKEHDPNYVAPIEDRRLGYYTSHSEGLVLVHMGKDAEGEPTKVTTRIGNHLEAIAVVDNPEQNQSALLLEFKTFQGHIRRVVILRSDLAGDGTAIISMLMGLGYAFKRKQKAPLLDYLHGLGIGISKKYTVTESTGWVGESFVMPHKTYGDPDLRYRDIDPIPDVITEIKGTLQGWKDNVAAHCAGNSRSILALGSSFAAPLLPIVDVESGGFHLVGATSQGKTTILSIAASVTGLKTVSSWRTTDNALEGGLAASNHLCLPLDELNQADPRKVGSIVYMLGNGIGKGRSTKEGTNRKSKVWLTLVLSSGETTIGKFMELAGEVIKGGQEVRLPNVPAIPENSKYGCFETIHGADTAAQFVSALDAAVKEHRGMALDAFLYRLAVDAVDPTFTGNLSKQVHLIAAKLCEGTKDSAIGRVAKRFALVQVALGLAHKYGLLPFDVAQVEWGVSECFDAWLKARGGDGSIEIKNSIDRIEHLLVTNEFSDRVFTLPDNNDRPVRNLLAYRTVGFEGMTEEFLIPTSVFDREFCDGVNKTELVKELQRLGMMSPPRSDGKSVRARRVKGKQSNFYVFPKCENSGDAGDAGDAGTCNPMPATIPTASPLHHYPKIAGDAGDAADASSPSLHHLHHQPKTAGDAVITTHNPLSETVSAPASPASPASPLKTDIGNTIDINDGEVVLDEC